MGMLLKAAFAFLVAFSVLSPDKVTACFGTARFRQARAELMADRPAEKLKLQLQAWLPQKSQP
jgi:hypothetical protein